MSMIKTIQLLGKTIILIEHDMRLVMGISDWIVVLDTGGVVGIGTHDELMQTCETYREIVYSQLSEEEVA